jgi:hypothetical protein
MTSLSCEPAGSHDWSESAEKICKKKHQTPASSNAGIKRRHQTKNRRVIIIYDTPRFTITLASQYGIYRPASTTLHYIALPPFESNSNHAQELHQLQSWTITGCSASVLRYLPVCLVLLQGLSKGRLEEAPQENLQVSQRGARKHAVAD